MAIKNRNDLKSFFVKNAIPTEGNFADLIDSQLNQAVDGVFKLEGEPLSIVAAASQQKRTLRLYSDYPAANPDWMISLNPAQDPANAATSRPGLGFTDGSGNTRLFIDPGAAGKVGVGTNTPAEKLHVAGRIHAAADLISVGPDAFDVGPNRGALAWGPYSSTGQGALLLSAWTNAGGTARYQEVGIHATRVFFGGTMNMSFTSAMVNLGAPLTVGGALTVGGGAAIAGDIAIAGKHAFRGNDSWLRLNQDGAFASGVHTPGLLYPAALNVGGANGGTSPGNGNAVIAGSLSVYGNQGISGTLTVSGGVAIGGDVALGGKHAFRSSDSWLRLNQDGAFASGVHTPGNFAPNALNVGGVNSWGNPGAGNSWFAGTVQINGKTGIQAGPFNGVVGDNRAISLNVGGNIQFSDTLATPGRMHLYGGEICYMLHKSGVVISKSWGGTGSLSTEGAKQFRIDHPLDKENRYLVHAAIEGPEAAVLYRGEAALEDGVCEVELPHYFEALTRKEDRTVQLTPRLEGGAEVSALAAGAVEAGKFVVRAIDARNRRQRFYWEVKAVRADLDSIAVEPLKHSL